MRDNFSLETKQQLAKRAGYLCSFPGCGALTIGPSQETTTSISSVGTACHISAASPGRGARRFDPNLTPEQRRDITNGIWMCYKHGKLIDTDEGRFSTELLKSWKTLAENVATAMVENGYDYKTALRLMQGNPVLNNQVALSELGSENEKIGHFISDSCVHIVWSKEIADAIRDFTIEHFRNAFKHGGATHFEAVINDDKIIIRDNGNEYNPQKLLKNLPERGGAISIQALLRKFSDKVVFSSTRENNMNKVVITILKSVGDIFSVTPCSIQLGFDEFHFGNSSITISESCNEFYIVLPPYFALSDVMLMPRNFPQFSSHNSSLTFIVEYTSDGVNELLKQHYPDCRIITLN